MLAHWAKAKQFFSMEARISHGLSFVVSPDSWLLAGDSLAPWLAFGFPDSFKKQFVILRALRFA